MTVITVVSDETAASKQRRWASATDKSRDAQASSAHSRHWTQWSHLIWRRHLPRLAQPRLKPRKKRPNTTALDHGGSRPRNFRYLGIGSARLGGSYWTISAKKTKDESHAPLYDSAELLKLKEAKPRLLSHDSLSQAWTRCFTGVAVFGAFAHFASTSAMLCYAH